MEFATNRSFTMDEADYAMEAYLKASSKRVRWGNIDKEDVTDHCRNMLANK